jgi:hypothetical protein
MFDWLFSSDEEEPLTIKEGSAGVWHYHLAEADSTRSLCGQVVMGTPQGLEEWKCHSDQRSSYCDECEQIYNNR